MTEPEVSRVIEVDIQLIETDKYPVRMINNEQAVRKMAKSIERLGLIQPLTVLKKDDGKYDLIGGHTRLAALKRIGAIRVPVNVVPADQSKALEMAVAENLMRTDLNPIEKAQAIQRLKDQGLTQREIAELIGRKEPEVSNLLALFKLEREAIQAIQDGKLAYPQAKALLSLRGHRDLQLKALSSILKGKIKARDAEKLVREVAGVRRTTTSWKLPVGALVEERAKTARLIFEFVDTNELRNQIDTFLEDNFSD